MDLDYKTCADILPETRGHVEWHWLLSWAPKVEERLEDWMDKSNENSNYNANEQKVPPGRQTLCMHLPTVRHELIPVVQTPCSTVLPGRSSFFPWSDTKSHLTDLVPPPPQATSNSDRSNRARLPKCSGWEWGRSSGWSSLQLAELGCICNWWWRWADWYWGRKGENWKKRGQGENGRLHTHYLKFLQWPRVPTQVSRSSVLDDIGEGWRWIHHACTELPELWKMAEFELSGVPINVGKVYGKRNVLSSLSNPHSQHMTKACLILWVIEVFIVFLVHMLHILWACNNRNRVINTWDLNSKQIQ